MDNLFKGIYQGKRVMLTGHTGFKGSWLLLWLQQMGATVRGYSLSPIAESSHIDLLQLSDPSTIGDIRDARRLKDEFEKFKPEIVFHLAAQPLVKKSYVDPVETFETNIGGTVNVLEAARHCGTVKVLVNITTDKVYQNYEWVWPYRESDRLGGHDPYSTSKACVELVHESYRKSFFEPAGILTATARAGNVIGGGDWAEDRLVPDAVKAAVNKATVQVRNPQSVRPWQHVLDPLSGYLLLGQLLLEGNKMAEGAWNFGPDTADCLSVADLLNKFCAEWSDVQWKDVSKNTKVHEANMLRLDCSKAINMLQWNPVWNVNSAIAKTAEWYKSFYKNKQVRSVENLREYLADARQKNLAWIS